MSKAILLILPLFMCMFMAMSVGAVIFLPTLTGTTIDPATGALVTSDGTTTVTDGSGAVTYTNETADNCIKFWDHYDQDGDEREFCLRGDETKLEVKNLKAYNYNDKATFVQAGAGVNADLFYDSDHRGDPFRVDGPASINLKDKWKNDVLSSFRLWKK